MDKWSIYKKSDDFRVAAPKSVLDLVEIKSIAENGIFEIGRGGMFTKMYKFSDINYETASVDEQIAMLENWARWLNSNSTPFKIIFNNKNKNMETMRREVLMGRKRDGYDDLRDFYNEEMEDIIKNGRQGIEQELYVVIRYDISSEYEKAKGYFDSKESNMIKNYRTLGSELVPLNATERLRVLHDFYRFGEEEYFNFDFKRAVEQGFDFKDAIINTRLDFSHEDYFRTDNRYCSAIYLKQLPTQLSDRFLVSLSLLPVKMICTLDAVPISDNDVDAELKSIYLGIEERIRKQNRTRVKQMDFSSDISLSTKMEKESVETMIKEKNEEDQHFFYSMLNIVVIADSLEQLRKDVDLIFDTAKNSSCIFDYSYMKQREALNTVLPIGTRQVSNGRSLQTKSLTALFPFNIQELNVVGGMWYGRNLVSKNIVTANRKRLVNPHGFFFGETGSGKTTLCKLELQQVFVDTDDDIIIIDPKNDYVDVCNRLNGVYTNISTTSHDRYNPLEYYDNGRRSDIAAEKSSLVLSIVETIKKEPLTAKESSIINTALRYIYNNATLNQNQPTLTDLYYAIGNIKEPEANDLQWCLDLFVNGSFNIFAKPSSDNRTGNRVTAFGLKDMGSQLRDVSMLIMLECVKERIMKNAEIGRATWLYIDEFHEVLHTEYSQEFIKSLWMLVRSLGGICTAMTQNVSDVLLNYTTRAMLENSEFVIVLKQQPGAKETIVNEMGLSPELVKYVTDESGFAKGLIRSGSVIVPFSIELNPDLPLSQMVNKNFHEGSMSVNAEPPRAYGEPQPVSVPPTVNTEPPRAYGEPQPVTAPQSATAYAEANIVNEPSRVNVSVDAEQNYNEYGHTEVLYGQKILYTGNGENSNK
jgi:type IV secretory pathway VirB4 component